MDSKLPLAIVLAQPELPTIYFCVGRGMGFYQGKHEFLGFFTILFIYRTWQVSRGQEVSFNQREISPSKGRLCMNYYVRERILQREPKRAG